MSNKNTCSDREHDSSGQPGNINTEISTNAVQITTDIVIGILDEASQDGGPSPAPVLEEKEMQKDKQTDQSPTVEPEVAAANVCPALDKTLDTTTSVNSSDEEAGGSMASLDEEKAWDPFRLSSKDGDAGDVAKNIQMLRRKCLVSIICIGFIALVGGLSSLTITDVANKTVSFANSSSSVEKEGLSSDVKDSATIMTPAEAPSSSQISYQPSLMPTSDSIIEKYTTSPSTAVPTDAPTQSTTKKPSFVPSPLPSHIFIATDEPTMTTNPPSQKPTLNEPTNDPSTDLLIPVEEYIDVPQYETFSFYVTGDAPYSPAEEKLVREQLAEISELVTEEDMFLFHVGDLMRARTTFCQRISYQFIEDAFTQTLPNLPVFLIPGDNGEYSYSEKQQQSLARISNLSTYLL